MSLVNKPTLYYWEERKGRRATLIFDSGYSDNDHPIGFIHIYELDHSRSANELREEIKTLGTPDLKWQLIRS